MTSAHEAHPAPSGHQIADPGLALDIIGPNLPARMSRKGEIHVHAHGCADVARQYQGHHVYTETHATVRSVVEDWYGDQIAENDDDWGTWEAYVGEFYFAPCVASLPTEEVASR